ncbi:glycosyltransferase [Leucobacter sp. L43]|uniref:glycosyltransferase n=1 Tax=Leucobacter sp. L43 TaxID=2798040 RepID=UPI0019089A8E|nr:glycosyltransferase family 2 protein [Leucobacter sp. L43]
MPEPVLPAGAALVPAVVLQIVVGIVDPGTEIVTEVIDYLFHMYDGMPLWALPVFLIALVLIIASFVSLIVLIARARRQRRLARRGPQTREDSSEAEFLWVYMVPALNEEVTITDSVSRLLEIEVTNKSILVINDGSDDATGDILANIDAPELTVLTRVAPNARQGKSEALNDAWRYLHRVVIGQGSFAGWDPQRVIVTIVDADGRLDRKAWRAAEIFDADDLCGGVQSQVRIYNRSTFLTWSQDLEFGVFGSVFQLGRMGWGTANMGGNGQFNRLAALDSVAVEDAHGQVGPWKAGRLTEDQDIGLRMIHAGWRGAQSGDIVIEQQGLSSLRALYRQRTRWAQGAWQVLDLLPESVGNRRLSFAARCDQLWYLLTPLIQAWVGLSVLLSVVFLAVGIVVPDGSIVILVLFYVFSATPGIAGVLFARPPQGLLSVLRNLLLAHAYLIYSWLIFPVVYRSLIRQLTGRNSWAKTKREAIEPASAEGVPGDGAA